MRHSDAPRPKDPHLGLRFWIQIDGIEIAGFSECSGLSFETEIFEYAEGGSNNYTHKLPVRTKYSNLVLKRGMDHGQDLYRWYVSSLDGNIQRRNISIILYGPKGGDPVKQWDFRGAFPVKWVGPDFRTEAGAVAVETLEIAHDGLIITSAGPMTR